MRERVGALHREATREPFGDIHSQRAISGIGDALEKACREERAVVGSDERQRAVVRPEPEVAELQVGLAALARGWIVQTHVIRICRHAKSF